MEILKRSTTWIFFLLVTTAISPIISNFAESIGNERGWFENSNDKVTVFIATMSSIFSNRWYQSAMIFGLGWLTGSRIYPAVKLIIFASADSDKIETLGIRTENMSYKIQSGISFLNNSGVQQDQFTIREHAELKSLFVSLRKVGLKVPTVPNTQTAEHLAELGAYCIVIYPLLQDAHINEAKDEAKRILKVLNSSNIS